MKEGTVFQLMSHLVLNLPVEGSLWLIIIKRNKTMMCDMALSGIYKGPGKLNFKFVDV